MNKNNIRDYAYTAGCIDCDGYILIKKADTKREKEKSPRYKLSVGLNGKDSRVQQWLNGRWGGNISFRDKTNKDKRHGINGTYIYEWEIHCIKAMDLLKKILPFLKYKKEQAETGILLQTRIQKAGSPKLSEHEISKREELYLKCKQLKKEYVKLSAGAENKCDNREIGCDVPDFRGIKTLMI